MKFDFNNFWGGKLVSMRPLFGKKMERKYQVVLDIFKIFDFSNAESKMAVLRKWLRFKIFFKVEKVLQDDVQ